MVRERDARREEGSGKKVVDRRKTKCHVSAHLWNLDLTTGTYV